MRVISAIDGTYNGIRVNKNMQAIGSDYQPTRVCTSPGQDSGGYFSYPYYEGVGWTQGYAWDLRLDRGQEHHRKHEGVIPAFIREAIRHIA